MAKIGTAPTPGALGRPGARKQEPPAPETKLRLRDLMDVRNKALLAWGIFSFALFALNMVLPISIALKPEWRFATMVNGALFSWVALVVTRQRVVLVAPVLTFLALQAWATVSYIYGFSMTARQDDWGKQLFFAYEIVMPYFVAYALCQLNAKWREGIVSILLWLLTLSAVVGIFQFIHVPGFDAVYKAYAWATEYDLAGDTYKGVRAVGLAAHPLALGIQCATAIAIVGSRFMTRPMKWFEFLQCFILSVALVMTQGRTLYVAGGLVILMVLVVLARRRPQQAVFNFLVILALFFLAAAVFPEHFQYAFSKVGSGGRDTFAVRKEIWQHYADIFRDFSITGIGPDASVFGASIGQPGRWSLQLMENAYLSFYAMLGIPGLMMFIGGFVATIIGCVKVLRSSAASMSWKKVVFVGLAFTIMLVFVCATGNVFDSNMAGHLGFLIAGAAAPLRNEHL